jgi:hypothetical protein
MQEYLARAHAALDAFDAAARALATAASGPGASPLLQKSVDTAQALLEATAALRRSLFLPENTAVDIADLHVRLEGETRQLARQLKALGEAVEGATGVSRTAVPILMPALQNLEEHAQRVAAAIFPSAIEGVRKINKALWNVRLIWRDYGQVFDKAVRGKLPGFTSTQLDSVDAVAKDVLGRFEAVNELLNTLVTAPIVGDSTEVAATVKSARAELVAAVKRARSKAADAYKPFHAVLGRFEKLASDIADQFDELRIPVFPLPGHLEAFATYVDHDTYRALSGVQRFALMNIGARINSVEVRAGAGETLAAPRFEIRVFDVFPDRIYFTARVEFLHAIQDLKDDGVFQKAPAGLHRYNKGSYKQREGRKGNLQVCYADGTPTSPADPARITVDADIDLYRGTVAHLFGEVLVNHLTGLKTDQFKVWDTLVANDVAPIGGFDVISV